MYLDPRTVIVINIFSAALLGIALLAVSSGQLKQIRGIYRWAIASVVHSLSWILYALRGVVPDFICIILALTLLLFSLAFYFKIIAEFTGKVKRTGWVYYLIALSVAGLSYFLWVRPDTAIRIVIISTSTATLLYAGAYAILSGGEKRPSSHTFTGIVFAISASILLFRALYALLWNTNPNQSAFDLSLMQSITFLTSYLSAAVLTFGFLLMSYDRYITQHEKVEEQIIQSEARLNDAQKNAKVGSWEFDLDTNELTWSKEQYRIFEMEEAPSDKLYELCRLKIHPDDLPRMDEAIRIGKEKGQGVNYQHRIVCKDGSIKHLLGKGEVFKSADGKRNMLRGTVQDVTERRATEQLLYEYEHFFNNSNDLSCIANTSGYFEVVNPKFEELLAYSKNELTENQFLNFVHPDDVAITLKEMETLSEGVKTLNFQNRYRKKNGEYLWFDWAATPNSRTGKVYAIAHDITERKKIEQLLKEYEYFFINSRDLSCIANFKGYFEIVNPKFEEVLGYSTEELLANKFTSYIHPDDIEATIKEGEKLQSGALSINFVNRYRKKDGTYLWFEWASTPDNRTGKMYSIARDITERKKNEETNKKFAILESKSKEMEQFAYIASHDLREPLLTIKNYVELFAEEFTGKLNTEGDEYLIRISRAATRMDELIKGLLDYSRLSKVKALQDVDCNKILIEVLDDLNLLIEKNQAHIIADKLPVLPAYPLELKQLFQNLLTNSIKFRKPDLLPEIHISAEFSNNVWTFKFRDNGIGIEDTDKEKIFGLFQRVHSRNEYPGSGIGLAYCKKIVELHHGNIWVDSIPGNGSSFNFTILAA